MGDTFTVIGGIVGAVTSLFGIGESLFGSSSVSAPKLQMPQVQQFQIPQADLQTLNQQISNNTQLSTAAQQAATDAINAYSQGQLTAAYAGQYQQTSNQLTQQVLQQLAAQGISQGSQQYTQAMTNLQTNLANLKSSLLQHQLTAGLQSAGYSSTAINNMLNSWQAQSNINAQNNQANIGATNTYNNAQMEQYKAQLAANKDNQSNISNALSQVNNLTNNVQNAYNGIKSGGTTGSVANTNNLISGSGLSLGSTPSVSTGSTSNSLGLDLSSLLG